MLVFTRKKNQQVVIDEKIIITVVEVAGDKIRLGIEAPREVPVHRREVYDSIHEGRPPGRTGAEGDSSR